MGNPFASLLNFFDKRERFLIVELLSHGVRVSSVKADLEKEKLLLGKIVETDRAKLKKVISKFGNLSKLKIIIGLHPRFATTIYSGISLLRDNPRDPIDDADLDNLLSQAVWKFFDRHRAKAATKMEVGEIDVLLADVRIGQIRLDGHRVVNPIGFKARTIEVQLSQTFTTRAIVNELKAALPLSDAAFISESGTAWLHVISQLHKDEEVLLANVFAQETDLFSKRDGRLAFQDQLLWGSHNLVKALAAALAVSPGIAQDILQLCAIGEVSPAVAKKLEGVLIEELQTLINGLETALAKGQRIIYINSFFDLPPLVFSNTMKHKFSTVVRLFPANPEFVSVNYRFGLEYKELPAAYNLFSIAALILESNLLPNDKMSQIARKRVRWLSPMP